MHPPLDRFTDRSRDLIRDTATRFRVALELGGLQSIWATSSPRGACGDTADLLGQFLRDNDLGEWRYASGAHRRGRGTHGWLEFDGMILDITADQFDGISEPVIFTSDRTWHDGWWVNGVQGVAGLDRWSGPTLEILVADYKVLQSRAQGCS